MAGFAGKTPMLTDEHPPASLSPASSAMVTSPLLRELVAVQGELWVTAVGRSMWPTIDEGDRVLLRPLPGRTLAVGDVVVRDVRGMPTAHRIAAASVNGVVTIGDGCTRADPRVAHSSLAAVAVARERSGVLTAVTRSLEFGMAPLLRGEWWRARLGFARIVRATRRVEWLRG